VHGDDFYGPEERDWRSWSPRQGYQRYFDHQRVTRQLLRPLETGQPASFQRYDWENNALADWVTVEPQGIVLVEGVYLLRRELRPLGPRRLCRHPARAAPGTPARQG
jgi:uridine kinase